MAGGMKQTAKAACAAAVHYSGLRQAMAMAARVAAGGRRTLILAYHRVVEDFDDESQRVIPGLLVSARTFERHIEEVRRQGYEFVSLAEALEVNAGLKRAKRDLAVMTFDDGYRDNYEVGFPLLQKHGVPATIYLPTEFIGSDKRLPHDRLYHLLKLAHDRAGREKNHLVNRVAGVDPWSPALEQEPAAAIDAIISRFPYAQVLRIIDSLSERLGHPAAPEGGALLDWEQCRTMQHSGLVSFGAHTVRHMPLHHEELATVEREVRESRLTVERELGAPCRDFAYPNGYYSKEIVRRLVRSGFRSGVTTEDALNRIGGDPFRLRRKTLWENHSRAADGRFDPAMLACHVDSIFGMLGIVKPVLGDKTLAGAGAGA